MFIDRYQFGLSDVIVKVTNRCNFQCRHCGLGDSKMPHDMLPDDAETLMETTLNPDLRQVIIYGGEPRVNKHLPGIISKMRETLHINGLKLRTELDKTDRPKGVGIEVFTNGFGMKDGEATHKILEGLNKEGVNTVAVSVDPPHQDFARDHGIKVNYDLIQDIAGSRGSDSNLRKEIVPEGMDLNTAGNYPYVIPIGRARNYTIESRINDGTSSFGFKSNWDRIRRKLAKEFSGWAETSDYSHCYCGPSKITRRSTQFGWLQKLGILAVEPDLQVNPCGMGVIPPIGSLKEQIVPEILESAVKTPLYKILSEEGPQGLARRLTSDSEDQIRRSFIYRTPCGVCEDMVQRYPDEINELLESN